MLSKKTLLFSYFLLILVVTLFLGRLWGNGFTSGDDGFSATARYINQGFWHSSWTMATEQGRFYQLIYYSMVQIPYLWDSLSIVNIFKIISNLSVIVAFFVFFKELFSIRVAFLGIFIYLGLFDTVGGQYNTVSGAYNPFHGLPIWFNGGFSLTVMSFALYIRTIRSNKPTTIPYMLFFLGLLSYESLLFITPIFPLLYFFLKLNINEKKSLIDFLKENKGLFVAIFLYLLIYILFRTIFPPTYNGTKGLSLAPLASVAKPIITFSLSGIYPMGGSISFYQTHYLSYIYSLLIISGILINLRPNNINIHLKNNILLASGIIPLIFLPNLIFGLTERYRQWVEWGWDKFYLGSYYSAFFIVIFLTIIFEIFFKRDKRLLSILVTNLLLAVIFHLTYLNHLNSFLFFRISQINATDWKAIEILEAQINQKNIDKICTNSFISSDNLRDRWATDSDYWSRVISRRNHRTIMVAFKKEDIQKDCDIFFEKKITPTFITYQVKNDQNAIAETIYSQEL